ncbi:tetratricopeptide repeat (TPR)-like superfamily protein [Wolffia australiana]
MLLEGLFSLLRECRSLRLARAVHQRLLSGGGFYPAAPPRLAAALAVAYAAAGAAAEARAAVTHHAPASTLAWNLLIKHEACHGGAARALSLCRLMRRRGAPFDGFTFPYLLKACAELRSFRLGAAAHAQVRRLGFSSNVFAGNALVAMYSRCGAFSDARQMFDEMRQREIDDVVSWNSMVACHAQNGEHALAIQTFKEMNCHPDEVSLVNVLPACAALRAAASGRELHGCAFRRGLFADLFVGNAVVDMYAKCGRMKQARASFQLMEAKDVVSWNALVTGCSQNGDFDGALELIQEMGRKKIPLNVVTWSAVIAGYAQQGHGREAVAVFRRMQAAGSPPNAITLISVLSACAAVGALPHGAEIHAYALRRRLYGGAEEEGEGEEEEEDEDLMVVNALVDMYCKCKRLDSARAMFNKVAPGKKNVVTWTVLIGGMAQQGDANDALELLSQMILQEKTVKPNAFTISCTLMACARLAALHLAKQLHGYVCRRSYHPSGALHVANCLIDTYAKCGEMAAASAVFSAMPQKNTVSWASLMSGYGADGRGEKVLKLFDQMIGAGLRPDGVVFLILLYACSHSGMVDRGLSLFRAMRAEFGLGPGPEHNACAVDMLGRAGRLEEAARLIEEMPGEPTPVVWVALLSACRVHSDMRLAERAAGELARAGFDYDGSYTLLSNVYAKAGRWDDVARVRGEMRRMGIRKRPGCSWVQGKGGAVASFYAGDRTHSRSDEIYALLAAVMERIRALGYVPEMVFALHDVDEEEKRSLLMEHSEKLALAFGLLSSPPGAVIRITKNLRVCGDCHTAMVFISRIVEHEIVVRDSSRFHRFKAGSCSCGGYW